MFNKAVFLLAFCTLFFFGQISRAEGVTFNDVNTNHWAAREITKAVNEGIVDGYPDGTFKPDNPVEQKEFISMLIRSYYPSDFQKNTGIENSWSKPYMDYAFSYGWGSSIVIPFPTSGALSSNINMTRGQAAKLITNATGRNYNQVNSIKFLLDSKIVQGKVDNTLEGFLGNDILTRAESLVLLNNIKQHLDILYPCPEQETTYDPKTVNTRPEENMLLEIEEPSELSPNTFSSVVFENPKSGFEKINTDTFSLTGSVNKVVGSNLDVIVEKKTVKGFVKTDTSQISIDKGSFEYAISLSNGVGIYRVSIYSQTSYNGVLSQNEKKLTYFYIEVVKH
jgi:hypothetical protein